MVVANHNDNDLSNLTTEKITRVASVGPGGRWKPAYQSISDANWYGACHPPRGCPYTRNAVITMVTAQRMHDEDLIGRHVDDKGRQLRNVSMRCFFVGDAPSQALSDVEGPKQPEQRRWRKEGDSYSTRSCACTE